MRDLQYEWDNMDWPERVLACMDKLGISSITDFANELDVARYTVYGWLNQDDFPNRHNAAKLQSIFGTSEGSLTKLCKDLEQGTSIDAIIPLIQKNIETKSRMSLSVLLHAVAAKVTATIVNTIQALVLVRMESIYNSYPAKETVKFEPVAYPEVCYEVTITHAGANTRELTIQGKAYVSGEVVNHFAAYISDRGIEKIRTAITRHFKYYAKHTRRSTQPPRRGEGSQLQEKARKGTPAAGNRRVRKRTKTC